MAKTSLKVGQYAPYFCLSDQEGNRTCLEDLRGKWVVLYFYPRDNTPGCSLAAKDFSYLKTDFEAENAVILGVSRDSIESHQRFIEKKELKINRLPKKKEIIKKNKMLMIQSNSRGKKFRRLPRKPLLIVRKGKKPRSG